MRFTNLLSDDAVMAEAGRRLLAARLNHNITQAQLADAAGISKSTIERLENGGSVQLVNLIRCMRALGILENFERFLPEPPVNPIDQLRERRAGRQRVRGVGKRVASGVQEHLSPAAGWVWGDRK